MTAKYGARWTTSETTFRVWAPSAESVTLCLFEGDDPNVETRRALMSWDKEDWAVTIPGVRVGAGYGFRAIGPYRPAEGHRFNPAKLLVDPYARAIRGNVTWAQPVFGYPLGDPDSAVPDRSDSTRHVPRSVVVDTAFDWDGVERPRVSHDRTVIYEAHVKGLTMLHPDVPPQLRGTYAGACHPAVVEHLQRLGVTAIELLPVHTHVNDGFLVERGLVNYWGYSTLGFFSPERRYAASCTPGGEVAEFKHMVREFHRAGIEVLIDVVYNHTAEANHTGPTLSFRGLHNAEFYWLTHDDRSRYLDLTGTGNTIKVHSRGVTRFVIDSLRYWVEEMGVDGFRFDLAPVVGRTATDFDRRAPIFEAIARDPVLSKVKMIAEPWDLGPGGYQVGGFPDNWSEWNDRFRDIVRSYWRSDDGRVQEMGFRLTGSADFYHARTLGATTSVNFVAAHDGMTVADLVTYQRKRNHGNGDNNTDGHDHDINQFIGPDGPTTDPDIVRRRQARARSLLGTLFVARGIPMILGGDEFGRTQQGNNNAYCHDSNLSWIDWSLRERNRGLLEFVEQASRLRADEPALRIDRFPDDSVDEADPWVWFGESGKPLSHEQWNDPERRSFGIVVDSSFGDHRTWLVILFNSGGADIAFNAPVAIAGVGVRHVERVLSSAMTDHDDMVAPAGSIAVYRVTVD